MHLQLLNNQKTRSPQQSKILTTLIFMKCFNMQSIPVPVAVNASAKNANWHKVMPGSAIKKTIPIVKINVAPALLREVY